ncbi:ComEC/Rec2 family competence protein [Flavobacterium panacagri]|uniref:ComEC/Rec2 family competence protein n=1 Tax=Flavobacterium panacagri TaxID=3034146 RepID=UPI0025A67A65|nr:MBL fold metallo-hydrolase [Flavobacterium panacagri]
MILSETIDPLTNIIKTKILILPAHHGDCFIVKTFDKQQNEFNILIDGGTAKTFEDVLKKELKKISFIDIVVLTHIDSDHIAGLIKFVKHAFFKPSQIGKYWFNSRNIKFISKGDNISSGQVTTFEELLIDKGDIKDKLEEEIIIGSKPMLPEGISIEIISPSREILDKLYLKWPDLSSEYLKKMEDISISSTVKPSQIDRGTLQDLALLDDSPDKDIMADIINSSSIAFILKTFDMSILFLGDAHPHLIEQILSAKYSIENKLVVDYVKISHHGSKNNTTNALLDMIDCDKFIISTNGGNSTHTHPDRETIARIIHHPERVKSKYNKHRKIYLNYKIDAIEKKAGKFICDSDKEVGNWELVENTNILENE